MRFVFRLAGGCDGMSVDRGLFARSSSAGFGLELPPILLDRLAVPSLNSPRSCVHRRDDALGRTSKPRHVHVREGCDKAKYYGSVKRGISSRISSGMPSPSRGGAVIIASSAALGMLASGIASAGGMLRYYPDGGVDVGRVSAHCGGCGYSDSSNTRFRC